LFGVAGGVLLLDEKLTANILLGALTILGGLALVMTQAALPAGQARSPT
jgi:drug/metabolite transporter (DMT)-like permease